MKYKDSYDATLFMFIRSYTDSVLVSDTDQGLYIDFC